MPAFRPNWFTSVMGTAVIAIVAAALTVHVPGAHDVALGAWALGVVGLVVLSALGAPALRGGGLRRFADNPHTAPFLGTAPMAALTVAAATVEVGRTALGLDVALAAGVVLWLPAAVAGCVCAVALPLRARRHPALLVDPGHPTWVLAAVPPLTAATTGAAFVPHIAAGAPRTAFLLLCGALLLVGVGGALAAIRLVLVRMARVGLGPARSVPALWIVLGPLGQVVAAVLLLGGPADLPAAAITGVAVGVWCVALGWLTFVLAATAWTARRGLPFSLAWWSFTFPVGTTALGTAALAHHTGAAWIGALAVTLFALLLVGWTLAAAGTLRVALRLVSAPAPVRPSAA